MAAENSVIVIGAGMGGLAAAARLAACGLGVTVLERADGPGGKMRIDLVGGAPVDAGPTVLTMRDVLEDVFADAGARLDDHVRLASADVLARHAWSSRERLDLFADAERSAEAIGHLSGPAEAQRYLAFCRSCELTFKALEQTFIRAGKTSPPGLALRFGLAGLPRLRHIRPFTTLWAELSRSFRDVRLQQLFARYATYSGSSPFLAPATLMLIAHVERNGVWLVEGGMHRLAQALAEVATRNGARLTYGAHVARILVEGGRAAGIELANGERRHARYIVANTDSAPFVQGLLGESVVGAVAHQPRSRRSLSALTIAVHARTSGFPLVRHNVFLGPDSEEEFSQIFRERRLPSAPTVYVCAQDRGASVDETFTGPERLLLIINAPPDGDVAQLPPMEIERCRAQAFGFLEACGLTVATSADAVRVTTPTDFDRRFPGTGGALYGQASHGWMASFQRPGARTRIPGLYLAGGSTHPGAGVPMAALSGRQAAASLLADHASTRRFHPAAMPGGTSTR